MAFSWRNIKKVIDKSNVLVEKQNIRTVSPSTGIDCTNKGSKIRCSIDLSLNIQQIFWKIYKVSSIFVKLNSTAFLRITNEKTEKSSQFLYDDNVLTWSGWLTGSSGLCLAGP